MSEPNSKFARRYDREFKENAVALVFKGRSQSDVSRDLGVSAWSLGEWVKKAKAGQALKHPKTLDAESAEARELRRLRAENDCLRQQRDILKKACGRGGGGDKRGLVNGRVCSAEVPASVSR